MPGHIPSLDERTLARLRKYVQSMRRETNGTLPIDQIVGMANEVRAPVGVTLDLRATELLGAPLLVVRSGEAVCPSGSLNGLSKRENQVCELIAQGKSNKQIAALLIIALATVKDHVHKILRKTGFPNRAALAVAYREAAIESST